MRFLILICFFLVLKTEYAPAQKGPNDLVLCVPPLREWTIFQLQNSLEKWPQVQLVGYDREHSCILIRHYPELVSVERIVYAIEGMARIKEMVTVVPGCTFFEIVDGQLAAVQFQADVSSITED